MDAPASPVFRILDLAQFRSVRINDVPPASIYLDGPQLCLRLEDEHTPHPQALRLGGGPIAIQEVHLTMALVLALDQRARGLRVRVEALTTPERPAGSAAGWAAVLQDDIGLRCSFEGAHGRTDQHFVALTSGTPSFHRGEIAQSARQWVATWYTSDGTAVLEVRNAG